MGSVVVLHSLLFFLGEGGEGLWFEESCRKGVVGVCLECDQHNGSIIKELDQT